MVPASRVPVSYRLTIDSPLRPLQSATSPQPPVTKTLALDDGKCAIQCATGARPCSRCYCPSEPSTSTTMRLGARSKFCPQTTNQSHEPTTKNLYAGDVRWRKYRPRKPTRKSRRVDFTLLQNEGLPSGRKKFRNSSCKRNWREHNW